MVTTSPNESGANDQAQGASEHRSVARCPRRGMAANAVSGYVASDQRIIGARHPGRAIPAGTAQGARTPNRMNAPVRGRPRAGIRSTDGKYLFIPSVTRSRRAPLSNEFLGAKRQFVPSTEPCLPAARLTSRTSSVRVLLPLVPREGAGAKFGVG
jgi:hypothetical protein